LPKQKKLSFPRLSFFRKKGFPTPAGKVIAYNKEGAGKELKHCLCLYAAKLFV